MADVQLTDVMKDNIIPAKRRIHDVVAGDGDQSLLVASGAVGYPVDTNGFEYKSDDDMWDPATSIFSDSIVDGSLWVKWSFVLNCAQANKNLLFEVVIPDPGGEIAVFSRNYNIPVQNTDTPFSNSTVFYVGAEALQYGFKVRITPDNDMTIRDGRSILIVE